MTRSATYWSTDPDRREVFTPSSFSDDGGFMATIGTHLQTFLACIAAGEPPPVTGLDGLLGLELVEAALRSHSENRAVTVGSASQENSG